MTNRMAKLDRKTNEAIAAIFSMFFPSPIPCRLGGFVSADNIAGQRLQSMKKGQDPAKEVDLVASINAAEKERGLGGDAGSDSDEE